MRIHGTKNSFSKKSKAIPIVIALLSMTAAAFAIAVVWQGIEEAPGVIAEHESGLSSSENETDDSLSSVSSAQVNAPASLQTASSAAFSGISASSVSEPENKEESEDVSSDVNPPREDFSYALPRSEPVPLSYFDDAIFFGDSISTGISSYNLMSNTTVMAFTGINTVNAVSRECVDTDEGRKTLLDAAKAYGDKKKVYIMLGGNGLGYDKASFIDGYSEFLEAAINQYPGAVIYVQTMMPVTDYACDTYPSVNNEIINEYNLAIQEMSRDKKVYLVDSANALMDEKGKLPDRASPVDGMHFGPEYYLKWFDYLRSHTAPVRS